MQPHDTEHRTEDGARDATLRRIFAAAERPAPAGELASLTAPAFRALVAERLRTLERDVAEVRSRTNGLLFVIAGAVVTQVLLRVIA
ncbi:MAG: hypothetical protein HYX50_03030 [Chloroflexi bacterium]|nr:hypothetical protein [Chloroflexota bacterium]